MARVPENSIGLRSIDFPLRCTVPKTLPLHLRLTLCILCLAWRHKAFLPDLLIRNTRACCEKHKRRSLHR